LQVYVGLGKYEDAIKCYDEIIKIKPDDAFTWYMILILFPRHPRALVTGDIKLEAVVSRVSDNKAIAWDVLVIT
jgi:tetratricopeptide (TPR) repeat protein